MSERYFLGLLVILSSISALWVSINPVMVQAQLWVAALLAVLGLVSLASINNRSRSGILLPLYFIATIAFLLFVYLSGRQFGIILLSLVLLALVGMIVSFGIPSGTLRKKAKKISVNVVAPERKATRKQSRRSKKKK